MCVYIFMDFTGYPAFYYVQGVNYNKKFLAGTKQLIHAFIFSAIHFYVI